MRKAVLKNFAKLQKNTCTKDLAQMFPCEFFEIFWKIVFMTSQGAKLSVGLNSQFETIFR